MAVTVPTSESLSVATRKMTAIGSEVWDWRCSYRFGVFFHLFYRQTYERILTAPPCRLFPFFCFLPADGAGRRWKTRSGAHSTDEKTLSTFPSLLFSPVRRVLEDYRTGGFQEFTNPSLVLRLCARQSLVRSGS